MKTTIEAFRDFYVALGGSLNDVKNIVTIPAMIEVLNQVTQLGNLTNVALNSPSDGQVLKYNGSKWVNATDTDTDELEDLSDVALTTPSNGQVLTYDGTSGKWKNADATGGAGGGIYLSTIEYDDGNYTCDHDAEQIYEAWQSGMLPIAIKDGAIYPLDVAGSYDGETFVMFAKTYVNSGASTNVVTDMYQIVTSEGTTTVTHVTDSYPAN